MQIASLKKTVTAAYIRSFLGDRDYLEDLRVHERIILK